MKYTSLELIPMPKEVVGEKEEGGFSYVKIPAAIHTDCPDLCESAAAFGELVKRVHSILLSDARGGVELSLDPTMGVGEYTVEITENGAVILSSGKEGADYALASLLQLMRPEGDGVVLPELRLCDRPECSWRALMVDIARKWHPFKTLLAYVDLCYLYKIKYFHIHFVDTQSYTLPSKRFPKMPTVGCHYSEEEIEYLNKYAKSRGVELIPEIELPGHSKAMVSAYPELFGNTLDSERVEDTYSLFNNIEASNIICVGKPGIMDTLRELLSEIIDMFPNSEYLHVGGDEATIADWASCRDCKRYMKENGIDGVRALYSHFVKLITDEVISLGKTPIVWEGFPREGSEEISRKVLVVAWESFYQLADELLDSGFTVINASWQPLYIVPENKRGGTLVWGPEKVLEWNIYNWQNWNKKTAAYLNPINVQPTEKVIGAQLCAWECDYDEEVARVRANLAALSERTWTVRRYATDEEFSAKLSAVLPLAEKIMEI